MRRRISLGEYATWRSECEMHHTVLLIEAGRLTHAESAMKFHIPGIPPDVATADRAAAFELASRQPRRSRSARAQRKSSQPD